MSSFSCDFLNYTKKVWRPELKTSSSIIDVVTNSRIKTLAKTAVNLKVADIRMPIYPFLDDDDPQVDYEFSSNPSRSVGGNVKHSQQYIQVCCTSKNFENRVELNQKSKKTIRIVKSEKQLARKVHLRWSKYLATEKCEFNVAGASNSTIYPFSEAEEKHFLVTRHDYLAKKYWNLWRKAVEGRVIGGTPFNSKERGGPLRIISSKSSSSRSSASQNGSRTSSRPRFGVQKPDRTVIEAQKQKIQEQESLIKELQLLRLKLEGEKFAMETRQLLDESERKCDKKLRSKVRHLSVCHANEKLKVDKYKDSWDFVTRMEVRADERRKRWDAIRQRKALLEQERLEKLRLEEEKRRQLEEEEKRRKIQQFRAEKERLADLKRKQEQERLYLNMLNSMAAEHYEALLLRSSLNAFKSHLLQEKSMAEEADHHYRRTVMARVFTLWRLFWRLEVRKRMEVAEEFYEHVLLKNGFERFKKIRIIWVRNNQVASDFYDLSLLKNYFCRWQMFLMRRQLEMKKKENLAAEFYEMQTLRNVFHSWKQLPRILFLEQEKEHRIRLWCNKVQELLPDFCPSYQCY